MSQVATFTLRCVGCRLIADQPAAACREQPFCPECFMPMMLEKVSIRHEEKGKGNYVLNSLGDK